MNKELQARIAVNSSTTDDVTSVSQPCTKPNVSCRTIRLEDNIVIVVDNSNYKAEYAEKCPFRAKITDKYESTVIVLSLKTGKEYELYYEQILEAMDLEKIVKMLDVSKYGS